MNPVFFSKQADLRKWFEKNAETEKELLIGYYKVSTGKPTITWSQSVDEALCFGWIDGIRNSINEESYCIRFTPRKPNSIWSAVNIKKVEELKRLGLMKPKGLALFENKDENKLKVYSFEKGLIKFSPGFEAKFKANKKAWIFFKSMAPSYQKPAINWVMTAKQELTRIKRLETLIKDSEAEKKIKPLSYSKRNY